MMYRACVSTPCGRLPPRQPAEAFSRVGSVALSTPAAAVAVSNKPPPPPPWLYRRQFRPTVATARDAEPLEFQVFEIDHALRNARTLEMR